MKKIKKIDLSGGADAGAHILEKIKIADDKGAAYRELKKTRSGRSGNYSIKSESLG